jgi:hypothetical protein
VISFLCKAQVSSTLPGQPELTTGPGNLENAGAEGEEAWTCLGENWEIALVAIIDKIVS